MLRYLGVALAAGVGAGLIAAGERWVRRGRIALAVVVLVALPGFAGAVADILNA